MKESQILVPYKLLFKMLSMLVEDGQTLKDTIAVYKTDVPADRETNPLKELCDIYENFASRSSSYLPIDSFFYVDGNGAIHMNTGAMTPEDCINMFMSLNVHPIATIGDIGIKNVHKAVIILGDKVTPAIKESE